jgi:hypothetical protein
MATPASQNVKAVGVTDEMTEALQAGMSHARTFYADGRSTLIDQISQEDWDSWDGSDELALVSDPDGLSLDDHSDCDLAA